MVLHLCKNMHVYVCYVCIHVSVSIHLVDLRIISNLHSKQRLPLGVGLGFCFALFLFSLYTFNCLNWL